MNGFHYVADLLKPSFARALISLVRDEFCYQAIQRGHADARTILLSSTGVERTHRLDDGQWRFRLRELMERLSEGWRKIVRALKLVNSKSD